MCDFLLTDKTQGQPQSREMDYETMLSIKKYWTTQIFGQ